MLNPNPGWRAVGAAVFLPLAAFAADVMTDNPFAHPSSLTFGFPDFAKIKDSDFRPAYAAGMAEHLREVEAIANHPEAATFDNTLAALERSGQLLGRVSRTFSNLVGAHTNDARRAIDREIAPQLAAHSDAIRLNAKLFARIRALHERRETLGLDAESKRLLERTYKEIGRAHV